MYIIKIIIERIDRNEIVDKTQNISHELNLIRESKFIHRPAARKKSRTKQNETFVHYDDRPERTKNRSIKVDQSKQKSVVSL